MSILQRVLGLVVRPLALLVSGTLLMVLVTWYGGELLRGTFGWPQRWLTISCCVAVVLGAIVFTVLRGVRAKRTAKAIEQEIRAQARQQADAVPLADSKRDIAELQQRFDEALDSLKSSKLGRGALYALPWYVIIGPPGSGKTTAITESGLNFPAVKGPGQKRGIKGIGGTRNCDWWFTDQAILLDTAGRYTTETEDRDEWLAFLGMIKRARKHKPINGVMVAISLADSKQPQMSVLGATDEQLQQHAQTIRQRIDELVKQLEVVFPVYLVFTKCDLLEGFVEFFGSLTKENRAQVWGATFDLADGAAGSLAERFTAEFDLLCDRLGQERLRQLVTDRPQAVQRKVFALPLQVRAARKRLGEFIALLTQPNPYSEASPVRGFYLTSGTQEGAPIDRVMQRLTQAHGLKVTEEAAAAAPVEAKSYFVRDLFAQVMVADRELARSSASVQRRRELTRKGILAGSVLALLVLGTNSVLSYAGTTSRLCAAQQRVAALREHAIDPGRTGAPDADTRQRLLGLRQDYLDLVASYTLASVLGPSHASVEHALDQYAALLKRAFLLPMAERVRRELETFVGGAGVRPSDGPSTEERSRQHARVDQLVLVYKAMRGEAYVDAEQLRETINRWNLWKWDPAQIFTPGQSRPEDDDRQHLDTYLATLPENRRLWSVSTDVGLVERANEALSKEGYLLTSIAQMLRENPALLHAPEGQLRDEGSSRLKTMLPSSPESLEAIQKNLSVERQKQLLCELAQSGPSHDLSLDGLCDYLADVENRKDGPKQVAANNLGVLRGNGALDVDPAVVEPTYSQCLAAIKELRPDLADLELALRDGGQRLEALRFDLLDQADQKLIQAQRSVDKALDELAKQQVPLSIADAVRSSLGNVIGAVADRMARDFGAAVQRAWQQEIGGQLDAMMTRFPFAWQSSDEVALADFAQLFSPGGRLKKALERIDHTDKLRFLRSRLAPSDHFVDQRGRLLEIQKAFFADGSDKARLLFHITRMRGMTSNVADIKLVIASGLVVGLNDDFDEAARANVVRTWEVGSSGTKIDCELTDKQNNRPVVATASSALATGNFSGWGFLRVLALAAPGVPFAGGTRFEWQLSQKNTDSPTNPWRAGVEMAFRAEGAVNPFAPGFFELPSAPALFKVSAR